MTGEKNWKWPDKFYMIAWKGIGVEVNKAWGSLMAKDAGMKLVVAPEVNSVNRFKWTGLRLFHMTPGGTTEMSQMIEADRKYSARDTGPFPVRAVWAQSRSHWHAPIKDTTSYVRVKDSLASGAGGR